MSQITSSIVTQLGVARQALEERMGPLEQADSMRFTAFTDLLRQALGLVSAEHWGSLNRAINAVRLELWEALKEAGAIDSLPGEEMNWEELVALLDVLPQVMVPPATAFFDVACQLGLSEAELRQAVGEEIYWLLEGEQVEVTYHRPPPTDEGEQLTILETAHAPA